MSSEPVSVISALQRGIEARWRFWHSIGGSGKNFVEIGKPQKGRNAIFYLWRCGAI